MVSTILYCTVDEYHQSLMLVPVLYSIVYYAYVQVLQVHVTFSLTHRNITIGIQRCLANNKACQFSHYSGISADQRYRIDWWSTQRWPWRNGKRWRSLDIQNVTLVSPQKDAAFSKCNFL